jgi:glycosyltransferase involved in cell wall biosynthesis
VDLRKSQFFQPSSSAGEIAPGLPGSKHADGHESKLRPAPAISVVIPLYNRAERIGDAIESVLSQSFANFELIVVDDGSTDDGPAVVESVRDPRVRLVRQSTNKGANAARNEGVRQARGRIITFLDSDDLFLPDKLQTVADIFERRPDLGVLMDSFRKARRGREESLCQNPLIDDPRGLIRALFSRRIWKSTSGISVARDVAIQVGLFDEGLKRRQDLDFLVRAVRAAPALSISDVTWIKTFTEDSISADLSGFMPSFLAFWERHPEYYGDPLIRRGFSLDLARHAGRRARRREFSTLRADLSPVAKRIGWAATMNALAKGAVGFRRLRRDRRSGGERLHRPEGR